MSLFVSRMNVSDPIDGATNTYDSSCTHKSYDCMINTIATIPYTIEDSLQLNRILTSCNGNYLIPQIRITWPNLSDKFASNLDKLLISLKAYYDSSNPVMTKESLIDILCQKDAVTILKNIRIKSMMMAWGSTFVEEPSWWKDTKHYQIFDIGDIFYYKYCFFWEEEVEDYKFQLQPVITNKQTVKDFEKACNSVMDELTFDFDFEPNEILFQPRSSKVCDTDLSSKNDYQIRYKKNPEFRFGPRKPGKRCIIPVHPGSVRDTIINQIPDLNTVMAIDKLTGKCLRNHPFTVINNVERFSKMLDEFHYKYPFFYCRDIEKEGITKPRYLLKIMLKALSKRCKYFSQVCTTDFFDGDWCQIDDQIIHSERGHGLGMGNSLTTLMQIILFRLSFNRYAEDHELDEETISFFTLNDDCVFGLNLSEDESFEFSQIDHEIMEDLGLIRKKTKSFLCKGGFVFLEIYYPFAFNRKDSIQRRTMLLPYSATNIVHAKDLMSLMTENPYFGTIISKWGYEFYPDEINQPRHFGGWFSKSFYGVDISLDYNIEEFTSKMSRAAQAVLASDKKIKRKLIDNRDPFNLLHYKNIDEYIFNKLPIAGSTMFSAYERLKIRNDFMLIYDRLYKKRQRIYEKSKYVDLKTFLTELRENSDRDIFISKESKKWIRDFDITVYPNGSFTDPYRYNYPICSAIRCIKGISIKGVPSSLWPITQADSSFSTSIIRSEIAEMNLDYYAFEYTDEDVVLPTNEEDFKEFLHSWRNPVAVGKYCQLRFNKLMIPEKKPSFIKYKSNFFKRDLTREEFILLEGRSYALIEEYIESKEELQEFFDRYDEEKKTTFYSNFSSSSSDSEDYPPSDPDNSFDVISKLLSKKEIEEPVKKTDFSHLIELLPEGWDLESFTLPENIIYVVENQDLFHPEIIDYVEDIYDKPIYTYNRYLQFMSTADPQSMYLDFWRAQLRILDRNPIIKQLVFSNMLKAEDPNTAEDDDEIEFGGDFDVF